MWSQARQPLLHYLALTIQLLLQPGARCRPHAVGFALALIADSLLLQRLGLEAEKAPHQRGYAYRIGKERFTAQSQQLVGGEACRVALQLLPIAAAAQITVLLMAAMGLASRQGGFSIRQALRFGGECCFQGQCF